MVVIFWSTVISCCIAGMGLTSVFEINILHLE